MKKSFKFEKPPIVIEYRREHNPIFNKKGKIRLEFNGDEFPIGKIFGDEIDGKIYKFKVINHRFIGDQVIAIIVDDAK